MNTSSAVTVDGDMHPGAAEGRQQCSAQLPPSTRLARTGHCAAPVNATLRYINRTGTGCTDANCTVTVNSGTRRCRREERRSSSVLHSCRQRRLNTHSAAPRTQLNHNRGQKGGAASHFRGGSLPDHCSRHRPRHRCCPRVRCTTLL
jgi:hypothetical protein